MDRIRLALAALSLATFIVAARFPYAHYCHADETKPSQTGDNAVERQANLAERNRLWQEAKDLREAGKLDEALQRLEKCLQIQQESLGESSDDVVEILRVVGAVAFDRQALKTASANAHRAAALHEKLHGRDDWYSIDLRLDAEYIDLWATFDEAQRRQLTTAAQQLSEVRTLSAAGKHPEALALARTVGETRRTILGKEHRFTADALSWQGYLLNETGDFAKAEAANRQVLETRERALGKNHPDYTSALNNLAYSCKALGDVPRAAALYRQALEIRKRVLGESDPKYLNSLDNLGRLYKEQRDFPQAERFYREALEIRKKVLGENHPAYADTLNDLGMLYDDMCDYPKSEAMYREALALRKKNLGESHPDTVVTLMNLGVLFQDMCDFAQTERFYREALEIRERTVGKEHLDYAQSLFSLGVLYNWTGKYAQAEHLLKRVIEIRREGLGEADPDLADALTNLAFAYCRMGDYTRSLQLYERASDIRKLALGEQHADYLSSLVNCAMLHLTVGDPARAEQLYMQALEIRKKSLGDQHPDYAMSLFYLADMFERRCDFARAEELFRQALNILKKTNGENDLGYAMVLVGLAELCERMADYSRAEPMLRQALQIQTRAYGELHPDCAETISSLAALYVDIRDYARAEPLYRQVLEIRKKTLGDSHPDYAQALCDLAGLYRDLRDYAQAELLYRQALDIRKKAIGESNGSYASALHDLGAVFLRKREFAEAEKLYIQALEIRKKALGEKHLQYANGLNALGYLYTEMGNYPRAEPFYVQALEIRRQIFGTAHPMYLQTLANLGDLYVRMGDDKRAEPAYREALTKAIEHLERSAHVQTERQQLQAAATTEKWLGAYVSLCLRTGRDGQDLYPYWLKWKGRALRHQRALRALADKPELAPKFVELDRVTARLARLALVTDESESPDAIRKEIGTLSLRKEQIEHELSLVGTTLEAPTLADVQASLPPGSTLIDFAEYTDEDWDPERKRWNAGLPKASAGDLTKTVVPFPLRELRWVAFVVQGDGKMRIVNLGKVDDAMSAIETWRKDFGASAEARDAGALLRKQIWDPLAPHLESSELVLVSPDGKLGALPLAALPGRLPNTYLIEDFPIAVIPTPALLSEIARTPAPPVGANRLLIVGDVDYDARDESPAGERPATIANQVATRGPARDASDQPWPRLSGTKTELTVVEQLYRERFGTNGLTPLADKLATEESLRAQISRHEYLHLATHGFFASEKFSAALERDVGSEGASAEELKSSQRLSVYHPGLLSGLVFSGANHPQSARDDGYLTAEEVSSLQLRRVQLCVLSACETGLGQIAGGEGMLGLQRAFQTAGARTVVSSLWKVDDAATQALMTEFYRNLWEKKLGKLEALRQAQLTMLRTYDPKAGAIRGTVGKLKPPTTGTPASPINRGQSPYYWAAFVLSGDWR